ncbi:MAG: 4'-phosphopantetheinyl transferase superfamily protein [Oscillospiraceae bacterium]|nr:4'-phosphopantetheinyl transferase superfamily protein [Oscillospiraceae bacterium]
MNLQIFVLRLEESPTRRQLAALLMAADGEAAEKYHGSSGTHAAFMSLAGHVLSRIAAARVIGVPAREVRFERDARGKPYISGRGDVFFNVSHSKDVCVCAVCGREIGVDVEYVRDDLPVRVAGRFFDPGEQRRLDECPKQEKARTFFTIWTQKESRVKLTGEGIAGLKKSVGGEVDTESFDLFERYVVSVSVFGNNPSAPAGHLPLQGRQ